jgi:hypothetical protein
MTKLSILMLMFCACAFAKTPQGCEANMQSVECREKVARFLQTSLNRGFPNLSVRTLGDLIVFTDPKNRIQVTQSEGLEAQPAEGDAVKIASFVELCAFGFKKMRIESDAEVGENYELSCPNSEEPPEAKTAISTETGSRKELVIVSASTRVDPTRAYFINSVSG